MIRRNKEFHLRKQSENLITANRSSRNWWSTIKFVMSSNCNHKESVPSLYDNDTLYTDNFDKANLLYNFFCNQTALNDDNVQTPVLSPVHESTLSSITLCPLDIKQILATVPFGKVVGSDTIITVS